MLAGCWLHLVVFLLVWGCMNDAALLDCGPGGLTWTGCSLARALASGRGACCSTFVHTAVLAVVLPRVECVCELREETIDSDC